MEVVGVVGHVHHDGFDTDPRPQVYFSYLERAQDRMAMVVLGGHEGPPTPAVLQAIREVDPDQPVYDVRMLADVLTQSVVDRWLNTILLAAFALIALTLATAGVYGVVGYNVTRQLREFGIRIALGATRSDVTRLVLGRGARLALMGIVAGLAGAFALTRTMQSLVFGITPNDFLSFAAAGILVAAIALAASYPPARRAASADATMMLRTD